MKINEYCKFRGISMRALAREMGLCHQYLARVARGAVFCSEKYAKNLMRASGWQIMKKDVYVEYKQRRQHVEHCKCCGRRLPKEIHEKNTNLHM